MLLTAPQRRNGVSTIARLLAAHLAGDNQRSTLYLTTDELDRLAQRADPEAQLCKQATGMWSVSGDLPGRGAGDVSARTRHQVLQMLKRRFDCVLLDAPSADTPECLAVAGLADGVLLVVSAGDSSRNKVRYAHQLLLGAGARVEGCCLNRRKYPIPAFLYRWFAR